MEKGEEQDREGDRRGGGDNFVSTASPSPSECCLKSSLSSQGASTFSSRSSRTRIAVLRSRAPLPPATSFEPFLGATRHDGAADDTSGTARNPRTQRLNDRSARTATPLSSSAPSSPTRTRVPSGGVRFLRRSETNTDVTRAFVSVIPCASRMTASQRRSLLVYLPASSSFSPALS